MNSSKKQILILAGDGIGPEVSLVAKELLDLLDKKFSLNIRISEGLIGGIAYEETGDPLPKETLDKAKESDAIILGAVGGPLWDSLPSDKRPEKGLLGIRSEFNFFARIGSSLTINFTLFFLHKFLIFFPIKTFFFKEYFLNLL